MRIDRPRRGVDENDHVFYDVGATADTLLDRLPNAAAPATISRGRLTVYDTTEPLLGNV